MTRKQAENAITVGILAFIDGMFLATSIILEIYKGKHTAWAAGIVVAGTIFVWLIAITLYTALNCKP